MTMTTKNFLTSLSELFDNACFTVAAIELAELDEKFDDDGFPINDIVALKHEQEYRITCLPGFVSWFEDNAGGSYIITDDMDKLNAAMDESDDVVSYSEATAFQPDLLPGELYKLMESGDATVAEGSAVAIWIMDRDDAAKAVGDAVAKFLCGS